MSKKASKSKADTQQAAPTEDESQNCAIQAALRTLAQQVLRLLLYI